MVLLSFVLTLFFKFHIKLVVSNSTTLDSITKVENEMYDFGFERNWVQVFGRNPWVWLLPITGRSGRPVGDGVNWRGGIEAHL